FDRVVRVVNAPRAGTMNPLIQANFLFESVSSPAPVELGGLTWAFEATPDGSIPGTAKFDLNLILVDMQDGLAGNLQYSTDVFEAATIERMLGHLQTLLAGVAADPDRKLSELPILTAAEREQILVRWNDTAAEYPASSCLHHLFEAQAARTPDATAVVFEDRRLTYAELNARANRLAHRLRSFGVAPDALVAICVERSLDMVVAALAVLKAGGAYVPLDPAYPPARPGCVLQEAKPLALLTQTPLVERLPRALRTLCLDAEDTSRESAENPRSKVTGANLAYVIFTSGSTGKPKGVQIEHHSVVNFLLTMRARPGLDANDRLLALTTFSFDIAGLELYLPLTVGASLEILSREVAMNGSALVERLAASRPTVMQATPVTWSLLLDAGWKGAKDLKVLVGGEALPPQLASDLLARCGSLWNMYGPTETTIWSTT